VDSTCQQVGSLLVCLLLLLLLRLQFGNQQLHLPVEYGSLLEEFLTGPVPYLHAAECQGYRQFVITTTTTEPHPEPFPEQYIS